MQARQRCISLIALLVAGVMAVDPIAAHPHILANVRAEIIASEDDTITAVGQSWHYDPAYSAFIMREIDSNGDGRASDEELADFAAKQASALAEFGFFTELVVDGGIIQFGEVAEVGLRRNASGAITLRFTLPLKTTIKKGRQLTLRIFDPQFFAYFTMGSSDVTLAKSFRACAFKVDSPAPIDLSRTRSIPAAFWAALDGSVSDGQQFVNRISVTCP